MKTWFTGPEWTDEQICQHLAEEEGNERRLAFEDRMAMYGEFVHRESCPDACSSTGPPGAWAPDGRNPLVPGK
eukprot:6871236-Heterocapsa_arctica.AAC.1